MPVPDYADVPDVPAGAEVDPHWQALLGRVSALPAAYLPPTMPGIRPRWMRASAGVLVGAFMSATACGVCLTYGPHLL